MQSRMDNAKTQTAFNTKHRTKYKQKRGKQQRKLKWRATRTSPTPPQKKPPHTYTKNNECERMCSRMVSGFLFLFFFFLLSLVLYISALILLYRIALVRLLFSMYVHPLSKLFSLEICFLLWHSDTNAINFYLMVYLLNLY